MKIRTTLTILLALMLIAGPVSAQFSSAQVSVDGQIIHFDQPPMVSGGRVLVPLRGVFERLGATVAWNPANRSVLAQKGSTSVALTIGSTTAHVNGQSRFLEAPPMLMGSRTLIPLRFVSEALGAEVAWREAERLVVIRSSPSAALPNPPIAPVPIPLLQPEARAVIESVTHNAFAPLRTGQTLTVTMHGTPGGTARFDIASFRSGLPMHETANGRYVGHYTVQAGDRLVNAPLVVHLRTSNTAKVSLSADQPISINIASVNPGPLFARIISPTANNRMPDSFTIVGRTAPGATVDVRVDVKSGGLLFVESNQLNTTVTADANGVFRVPFNGVWPVRGGSWEITATARDEIGRTSTPDVVVVPRL